MVGLEQIKLFGWLAAGEINPVGIYTFNSATLSWEPQAPITGGGGGGGAVTVADGVAQMKENTRQVMLPGVTRAIS